MPLSLLSPLRPLLLLALSGLCLATQSTTVRAASLQLAPTSLTLTAQQSADGLWLSNSGSAPVQV